MHERTRRVIDLCNEEWRKYCGHKNCVSTEQASVIVKILDAEFTRDDAKPEMLPCPACGSPFADNGTELEIDGDLKFLRCSSVNCDFAVIVGVIEDERAAWNRRPIDGVMVDQVVEAVAASSLAPIGNPEFAVQVSLRILREKLNVLFGVKH